MSELRVALTFDVTKEIASNARWHPIGELIYFVE